jgi:hypothetical protein
MHRQTHPSCRTAQHDEQTFGVISNLDVFFLIPDTN